jgi:hypothetical protein
LFSFFFSFSSCYWFRTKINTSRFIHCEKLTCQRCLSIYYLLTWQLIQNLIEQLKCDFLFEIFLLPIRIISNKQGMFMTLRGNNLCKNESAVHLERMTCESGWGSFCYIHPSLTHSTPHIYLILCKWSWTFSNVSKSKISSIGNILSVDYTIIDWKKQRFD